MKGRSILLLAISAVLGILAVGLVHGMTQPVSFAASDTRKVVVAGLALKFGDRITADDLRLIDFPSASVPGSAFASIEELVVAGEPRVALTAIEVGDLVLASKVSGRGGKASLSTVIDPTMRAVTIRVDDVSGTAGFITPSDRVDVMLTRTDVEKTPRTDMLLQDIKVLAIDQEANEHKDKPTVAKAVTLEVRPEEAQKIALARTLGTLNLSLRNLVTSSAAPARSISASDLFDAPQKRRPGAKRTLEIIRGAAATTYNVQ